MALFVPGSFTLASGGKSTFKVECDALTDVDWLCLAELAVARLPSFKAVEGVPRGGLPFSRALHDFATSDGELDLLIADDVWTTGGSIARYVEEAHGRWSGSMGVVVAFNRSGLPMSTPQVAHRLALWTLAP